MENKDYIKIVLGVIGGTLLAYYAGAMIDFLPFYANDLVMREIGFCTLIICTVIAACTCLIINEIRKK